MNPIGRIGEVGILKIWGDADGILTNLIQLFYKNDPDRRGGYLTVLDRYGGTYTVIGIGQIPKLQSERCFRLSLEKCNRLASHPNHLSSWQSRNPNEGKWGGAISTGQYILSFSGLSEPGDEALVLMLSSFLCWYSLDDIKDTARISSNTFFLKLYSEYGKA